MKTIRELEREGEVITAQAGIDAIHECLSSFEIPTAHELIARRRMPEYLELFRPQHRFAAYRQIAGMLNESERARLLRNVWGYDLAPSVNEDAWRQELQMCARHPEVFLSEDDRIVFDNLPVSLTIYRSPGIDELVPRGFSWTFDRDWADMFSSSWGEGKADNPYVFQAECEPHKAVACVVYRHATEELIIFPERIKSWERIPSRPWEWYEENGQQYLRSRAYLRPSAIGPLATNAGHTGQSPTWPGS